MRLPITSKKGRLIEERTGQALLREQIKTVRRNKLQTESNISIVKQHMIELVDLNTFSNIVVWSENKAEKVFKTIKGRQQRKFQYLLQEKNKNKISSKPQIKRGDLVVNLSSYQLDECEKKVLSLGLNFAIPNKTLPVDEIIANTELTAKTLNLHTAQQLRERVKLCIETYKPPQRSNLDKNEYQAISRLKKNDSIVILPADKGNATVVMNKDDYRHKIQELLDENTYKKLKKDPTKKLERTISEKLKSLESKGETKLRSKLAPQNSYLPQLYGLPKLHKKNIPLRPIVSSIGSATYLLSKELARILSPLRGQTKSYIKNSKHFVEKLNDISLEEFDKMVSLFTKVPIDECLDIVEEKLREDDTLGERTMMSPQTISSLIKLCMTSTYTNKKKVLLWVLHYLQS